MTNYSEMPAGPEMDAMIAEKVMGWTSARSGLQARGERAPPDGWSTSLGFKFAKSFTPSANIAHAWIVIEEMTKPSNRRDAHGMPVNTLFAAWFKQQDLLAYSATEAALRISQNALRIIASAAGKGKG